ncbi:hypothetical protein D1953_04305 [Peribacillus asahii]|uniref:Integrase n=1 Tax=Peribacillus asahii TaxID=228899 RepID=A0A398BDR0_9BACI|nr:hypothetical protein D1953_04305 [Peribacillus asahii]
MYSLLNQAFDTAVDWNLAKGNPIKGIGNPVKNDSKVDKNWNREEINTFLLMASEREIAASYLVSIHTGIRRRNYWILFGVR